MTTLGIIASLVPIPTARKKEWMYQQDLEYAFQRVALLRRRKQVQEQLRDEAGQLKKLMEQKEEQEKKAKVLWIQQQEDRRRTQAYKVKLLKQRRRAIEREAYEHVLQVKLVERHSN